MNGGVSLLHLYVVLSPEFDVVDKYMRDGDFILVVEHREFFLHHPVVDVMLVNYLVDKMFFSTFASI